MFSGVADIFLVLEGPASDVRVDPLVYELFGVFLGVFECVGALVAIFWVVSHPRLRGKSLGRGRDVQVVGLLYCVLTPPALDV